MRIAAESSTTKTLVGGLVFSMPPVSAARIPPTIGGGLKQLWGESD
jgi:hypothetical protein